MEQLIYVIDRGTYHEELGPKGIVISPLHEDTEFLPREVVDREEKHVTFSRNQIQYRFANKSVRAVRRTIV